jgi:hypothetical protein
MRISKYDAALEILEQVYGSDFTCETREDVVEWLQHACRKIPPATVEAVFNDLAAVGAFERFGDIPTREQLAEIEKDRAEGGSGYPFYAADTSSLDVDKKP